MVVASTPILFHICQRMDCSVERQEVKQQGAHGLAAYMTVRQATE
jgi:hypothetical protein